MTPKQHVDRMIDEYRGLDDQAIALGYELWPDFLKETGLVPNDKDEVTYRGVLVWKGMNP